MTQIQRYDVVEDLDGFQLRRYAAHNLVSKAVAGSLASSGNQAFGYLAGYISGQNATGSKIEMTAPVLQKKTASGFEVSFVMPHDLANPPKPAADLSMQSVEPKLMAALRFSGSASDSLFERKAEQLLELAKAQGLKPISEVMFARYNGPWTPPPLRRNEVLVEVERN